MCPIKFFQLGSIKRLSELLALYEENPNLILRSWLVRVDNLGRKYRRTYRLEDPDTGATIRVDGRTAVAYLKRIGKEVDG